MRRLLKILSIVIVSAAGAMALAGFMWPLQYLPSPLHPWLKQAVFTNVWWPVLGADWPRGYSFPPDQMEHFVRAFWINAGLLFVTLLGAFVIGRASLRVIISWVK
jgi:hypothetical protein